MPAAKTRPVASALDALDGLAQGRVSGHEFAMRTRDGSVRDMMTSTVAIDIGGTPCLISIARDIGDQRRAEEAFRNLNVALEHRVRERTADLEEAVRELESFSYSVSHDLRTPLRAIAGYAKVIEEDYSPQIGAEGRAQLGRIIANAIRMGELIDDLLDFSRIGRVELKRSAIDMAGLAREVLDELPGAGAGRQVEIRIDAMPTVLADRSLIRQVWLNLLGNALKFTRIFQGPMYWRWHEQGYPSHVKAVRKENCISLENIYTSVPWVL